MKFYRTPAGHLVSSIYELHIGEEATPINQQKRGPMTEEIKASPELQKFFERLLIVKARVHSVTDEMDEIYTELNEIIKETK